jgi:hypothetical protein
MSNATNCVGLSRVDETSCYLMTIGVLTRWYFSILSSSAPRNIRNGIVAGIRLTISLRVALGDRSLACAFDESRSLSSRIMSALTRGLIPLSSLRTCRNPEVWSVASTKEPIGRTYRIAQRSSRILRGGDSTNSKTRAPSYAIFDPWKISSSWRVFRGVRLVPWLKACPVYVLRFSCKTAKTIINR